MINDKRLNEGQWFLRGSVSFKWHLSGLIPRVPCGALTTISPPPRLLDFAEKGGLHRVSITHCRKEKPNRPNKPVQWRYHCTCARPHIFVWLFFFFFPQGLLVFPFFFFFFFLRNEYYKNRIQLAQPTLSSIMKWRDICTYAYWRFQHLVNSWP